MAKILNKILDYIGLEEVPAEVEQYNEEEAYTEEEHELEESSNFFNKKRGKVVDIASANRFKVIVSQPMSYDETQTIIDNLRLRKPVIVNLEMLEVDTAQRVLDFASGAVYALRGNIQKISKGIFVLVPSNVDILGNVADDHKNRGFYNVEDKCDR
ncbi:MAG: cell division protein SepF [Bacillota bacterium]|nr:cell division protein SepF [Bacillota bacterium]